MVGYGGINAENDDRNLFYPAGVAYNKSVADKVGKDDHSKSRTVRTREYFAEASRKSRKRRKDEMYDTLIRNWEVEADLIKMKNTIKRLNGEMICLIESTATQQSKRCLTYENTSLKAEVLRMRCMSDQLMNTLTFFQNSNIFSAQSRGLTRNLCFILDSFQEVVSQHADRFSLNTTQRENCPDEFLSFLETAFKARGFQPKRKVNEFSLLEHHRFSTSEIKGYEKCLRIDVNDIPISRDSLTKFWRKLDIFSFITSTVKSMRTERNSDSIMRTLFKESCIPYKFHVETLALKSYLSEVGKYYDESVSQYNPTVLKMNLIQDEETELLFISASDLESEKAAYFVQAATEDIFSDMSKSSSSVLKGVSITDGSTAECSNLSFVIRIRLAKEENDVASKLMERFGFQSFIDNMLNYNVVLNRIDTLLKLTAKYLDI